jgi:hypothetical protein
MLSVTCAGAGSDGGRHGDSQHAAPDCPGHGQLVSPPYAAGAAAAGDDGDSIGTHGSPRGGASTSRRAGAHAAANITVNKNLRTPAAYHMPRSHCSADRITRGDVRSTAASTRRSSAANRWTALARGMPSARSVPR